MIISLQCPEIPQPHICAGIVKAWSVLGSDFQFRSCFKNMITSFEVLNWWKEACVQSFGAMAKSPLGMFRASGFRFPICCRSSFLQICSLGGNTHNSLCIWVPVICRGDLNKILHYRVPTGHPCLWQAFGEWTKRMSGCSFHLFLSLLFN